jgi:hypothetical protein
MMSASLQLPVAPPPLLVGARLGQLLLGPDRRTDAPRERLLTRIRSEFSEMPCLRLSEPQAQRLFGLRGDVTRRLLKTLVCEGILWKGDDGRYGVRAAH